MRGNAGDVGPKYHGYLVLIFLLTCASNTRGDETVERAVRFLKVEVPAWARDNHCFSCHNNGDAARALYRASSERDASLAETTRWLESPARWDKQGEDGPMNDKRLARLQFALALATAIETGASSARDQLKIAADRVAKDLTLDGGWPAIEASTVGSPVSYGPRLATSLAVKIFRVDGGIKRHAASIAKAEAWLRAQPLENVVEAAAVLLIEPQGRRTEAGRKAQAMLLIAQAKSGGWGPYPNSPTEAFDTALAMIALVPLRADAEVSASLIRARQALIAMQNPDGSFPGSTRPPGGESYAQRISTTAWAALALIEMADKS